jgi:hypothetical protein
MYVCMYVYVCICMYACMVCHMSIYVCACVYFLRMYMSACARANKDQHQPTEAHINAPCVIKTSTFSGIRSHFCRIFSPLGRLNAQSQNSGCHKVKIMVDQETCMSWRVQVRWTHTQGKYDIHGHACTQTHTSDKAQEHNRTHEFVKSIIRVCMYV